MKTTLNPKEGSNTFNPVANVSLSEVPVIPMVKNYQNQYNLININALITEEFTLRDVITKFKTVDELTSFADLCESVFLVGGDYSQIFNKSQA